MKNLFTLILLAILSHFTASSLPKSLSPATSEFAQIRSNLYIVAPDKSTVLMDGTLTQFDTDYSNAVDGMDARKMFNSSENFGMLRGTTVLIIERRRTIQNTDSIFFKMWNMRVITYQLEFVASNLNTRGRVGVMEDNYLHTSKPIDLNGTTRFNFSVTSDPASKASDRFTLIFSNASLGLLPLTFTSTSAFQQKNSVAIDWKTSNENNVKQFDVERSTDGNHFEKATDLKANNSAFNNYHWEDNNPADGNNFYRVRSVEIDGKTKYSDIMKVYIAKGKQNINIFPNPATGNNLNLQLSNQPAGIYEVRLLNSFGQTFMVKSIQHPGGSSTEKLRPSLNIPKGIYQLEIKTPTGEKKVISIVF